MVLIGAIVSGPDRLNHGARGDAGAEAPVSHISAQCPPTTEAIEGGPITIALDVRSQADGWIGLGGPQERVLVSVERLEGRGHEPQPVIEQKPAWRVPAGYTTRGEKLRTWIGEFLLPGESARRAVHLRDWLPVVPAGQYRVTITLSLGAHGSSACTTELTVRRDPARLSAELQRLETAILRRDFHFDALLEEARDYDPKHVAPIYLDMLEKLWLGRHEPWVDQAVTGFVEALEHGGMQNPDAALGRLAAFCSRSDVPPSAARTIRNHVIAIRPARRDEALEKGLRRRFGVVPTAPRTALGARRATEVPALPALVPPVVAGFVVGFCIMLALRRR